MDEWGKLLKLITLFILLGSLLAISIHPVSAEDQYPCKPAPDINTVWYKIQKMDKTYKVRRYLGPHTFDIPYGYFTGRQSPEEVNCYPKMSSLEFAFWLPDLRSPQKDMWYDANFRPKEEGRPAPGPEEYIVKILSLKFVDTAKGESESPSIAFSNGLRSNQIIRLERKYGLLHELTDSVGAFEDNFADISQRDYKIQLSCSTPESKDENPLCKVYLYLTDMQLEAILLMPVDALPEWQNVKDGVRTLIEQWRVKD